MKLLYFAWLRQKIGVETEQVALPDDVTDVAGLIVLLKGRGDNYAEALKNDKVIKVAVNQAYARPGTALKDSDEVALFPPVTGG